MTANQLKYLELQEIQRSNLAREKETVRSNRAQETLTRTRDFNQAQYWQDSIGETRRSNIAREEETLRSNLMKESLGRLTLDETVRSNKAREAETYRHNVNTEGIDYYKAQASHRQADAALSQAAAAHRNVDVAQYRANTDRMLGLSMQAETRRHNLASESISESQLAETERSNLANESIKRISEINKAEANRFNFSVQQEANDIRRTDMWLRTGTNLYNTWQNQLGKQAELFGKIFTIG